MFGYRYRLAAILLCSVLSLSRTFAQITDESWKVYDDSLLSRIDITVDPARLAWMYQNVQSDSMHVSRARFRNRFLDVTFDSVGFRLRGNTSRNAKKKSFKLEFNAFISGGRFNGLKDLNLNGEHNDPSIIRSKLCFNHFINAGAPASRAAHCEVYINGVYYGLYISVENIDDTFLKRNFTNFSGNLWKCLYPADLKYLGENQQAYISLNDNGRPAYELKTNKTAMDFSKLVRLIRIVNNTSDNLLADSLESVISLHDVLRYYALNVLLGNWDTYWSLMNNYYLYHDPGTDMFRFIPYDCDNTFGVDWFNVNWSNANPYSYPKAVSGSRPLADRVIANAQYRNLYTHFLSFYSQKLFTLNLWESEIDRLKQMITGAALSDTFRTQDYGFTANDFFNSYGSGSYSNQHVKFGLKQFINARNASLFSQLNYVDAKPLAYALNVSPPNPLPQDSITVTVSAFANPALSQVSVQFTPSGGTTTLSYPMKYSPVPGTKKAEEADRYVYILPPLGQGGGGKISIYLKDVQNREMTYPRKGPIMVTARQSSVSAVINEFLADNVNSAPDPSGDHDDWVELYNPLETPVPLSGKYLTDDKTNLKKWRFTTPNLVLQPRQYIVVWCDEQASQPGLHANFKLSKSGEFLALVDSNGVSVLDSLTFGPQKTDTSFGRAPDGAALWKAMTPTPGASNVPLNVTTPEYLPLSCALLQNYPNPFNPVTSIRYRVGSPPERSSRAGKEYVSLKVYDMLGREAVTLVNEEQTAGNYEVRFDASLLPSGTYFYELRVNDFHAARKMIFIK